MTVCHPATTMPGAWQQPGCCPRVRAAELRTVIWVLPAWFMVCLAVEWQYVQEIFIAVHN
jgi:hypothetical protein